MIIVLIWLITGVLIGALANGAKLRPAEWGPRGWLWLLAIGALTALVSGWIGMLLLGIQFATVTAIWVTVIGVTVAPRVGMWIVRMNRHAGSSDPPQ